MKAIILTLTFLVAGYLLTQTLSHKRLPKSKVKLPGFTVSIPQAAEKQKEVLKTEPRRSALIPLKSKQLPFQAASAASVPAPLTEAEKIDRAKFAWIKIRAKAMDRLRIDSHTREQIEDLKRFYKGDEIAYNFKLRELIGEEEMNFLYNVREEFKSRILQKMNIEIGPQLGSL